MAATSRSEWLSIAHRWRWPGASAAVIAATWVAATSRASTIAYVRSGQAGKSRSISFFTASWEVLIASPYIGPRTRPGFTVVSSIRPPASCSMKAHAARSAMVFDCS